MLKEIWQPKGKILGYFGLCSLLNTKMYTLRWKEKYCISIYIEYLFKIIKFINLLTLKQCVNFPMKILPFMYLHGWDENEHQNSPNK